MLFIILSSRLSLLLFFFLSFSVSFFPSFDVCHFTELIGFIVWQWKQNHKWNQKRATSFIQVPLNVWAAFRLERHGVTSGVDPPWPVFYPFLWDLAPQPNKYQFDLTTPHFQILPGPLNGAGPRRGGRRADPMGGKRKDRWMNCGEWGREGSRKMRADSSEGGKTESRWRSWHLSSSEICLELFSTCLKRKEREGEKKEPILHGMPEKDTLWF